MAGAVVGLLFSATMGMGQERAEPRSIAVDNAGFEQTRDGGAPADWYGNTLEPDTDGAGHVASLDRNNPAVGASSLKIQSVGAPTGNQYGSLSQQLDVSRLRGRKIRLTAKVRAGAVPPVYAGLWLRVDRQIGLPFFIDNMANRPVTASAWGEYVIEAPVAVDAKSVIFGVSVGGQGAAWFDDVRIEDIGPLDISTLENPRANPGPPREGVVEGDAPPSPISARGLDNLAAFARLYALVRWFHPHSAAMEADWTYFLIAHLPAVEAAKTADELAAELRTAFGSLAPMAQITAGDVAPVPVIPASDSHILWKHTGYADLPGRTYSSETHMIAASDAPEIWRETLRGGVAISLPLSVPINAMRQALPLRDNAPQTDLGKPEGWVPAGFDRTTRLASVVAAWAVLDHFYPYWDVVDSDWDAALGPALQEAATAADDIGHLEALLRLTEKLQDGHGIVLYRNDNAYILPIDWSWVEGQLVVTAVAEDVAEIARGWVVQSIDGVPAEEALEHARALVSGSPQTKRHAGEHRLRVSPKAAERRLLLQDAAGRAHEITVPLRRAKIEYWQLDRQLDRLTELEPSMLYADLTRITAEELPAAMEKFAQAEAILFDLRGYLHPMPAYLAHMTDAPMLSPSFNVPIRTSPDGTSENYIKAPWQIAPALPRYTSNIVWLTNGSAGSSPESALGTVKGNGLGMIVGSATAGANGNVATTRLPGGYVLRWTGMQVVNQDGSQHHNIGVLPDLAVEPTLQGIREGRDEVLEAGLRVLRENREGS